jgi:hypothetical protein
MHGRSHRERSNALLFEAHLFPLDAAPPGPEHASAPRGRVDANDVAYAGFLEPLTPDSVRCPDIRLRAEADAKGALNGRDVRTALEKEGADHASDLGAKDIAVPVHLQDAASVDGPP